MNTLEQLGTALAGRYSVVREIGAGGMATVYLARDIKHGRDVALKVLRRELGAVLGPERFFGEIRVTAQLQHPHLVPLFDSGEAEGMLYYVMPFVDGESLRARLERERQLPIEDAVHIAVAAASALDYAHRRGVIHRDLKPENILLVDGEPLVADFGIALAVSRAGGARITESGISLGTPQYMSPEQATGDRQLDARTDIYSLGCVLYEMLTGDPPHTASTAQGIIARVLTDKPRDVRATRETVPVQVAAAVDRALEKIPADRWPTAAQFCDALRAPAGALAPANRTHVSTPSASAAAMTSATRRRLLAGSGVLLAAALGTVAGAWWTRAHSPPAPPVRFMFTLPGEQHIFDVPGGTIALSPDGTRLVYVGVGPAGRQLYVRSLGDLEVKPLPGTLESGNPFFSPDGEWVGFFAGQKLKKVRLSGGEPVVLADAPATRGASWTDDDAIIFAAGGGLLRVASSGGTVDTITRPDSARGEIDHSYPFVIPGARVALFTSWKGSLREGRLATVRLDGKRTIQRQEQPCLSPRFVEPKWLVCPQYGGTVSVMPFDPRRQTITGPPTMLVQDVIVKPGGGVVLALSANGTLAYPRGPYGRRLVLTDSTGVDQPLGHVVAEYSAPRLAPDGRRLAVAIGSVANSDIWIYEMPNGPLSKLTAGGANVNPEWTPDGQRVIFGSFRNGNFHLFWQKPDGSAPAESLLAGPGAQVEAVVAPNGRDVVVRMFNINGATMPSLGLFRIGETKIRDLLRMPRASVLMPRLSPDGHWLTYMSNESGRNEIYVRAFPSMGDRVLVSEDGGEEPLWSADGRTLYYRTRSQLVAARVKTSPTFEVLDRHPLFEAGYSVNSAHANYDVTRDGRHFVLPRSVSADAPVVVVMNWLSNLR